VCKKLIKNSQPFWKNVRKPQGGFFLTHTVVLLAFYSQLAGNAVWVLTAGERWSFLTKTYYSFTLYHAARS